LKRLTRKENRKTQGKRKEGIGKIKRGKMVKMDSNEK
jgi:hypothetical protein